MTNTIHPVFFEGKKFENLKRFLSNFQDHRILILVDENTREHCLPVLMEVLADFKPGVIEIPSGEIYKNFQTCQLVWNQLMKHHSSRKTMLVNLGGGVICDLGGFAASVYKRGIPFVHVPTTLLSMVDASIGGKTGIDYRAYKNQLGVFAHPKAVFIHTDFFASLNMRQMKAGFAEMLKHALIYDAAYWKKLTQSTSLFNLDWNDLVKRSIEIKMEVVGQDFYENNLRKILNFGHTLGHAFESFSLEHHDLPLLHGEAIALGIMAEADLSVGKIGFPEADAQAIKAYISEVFPIRKFFEKDVDELMEFIMHDKKNTQQGINFTLLKSIGEGVVDQFCTFEDVKKCLIDFINREA